MSNNSETIFIDGQLVDLNSVNIEKLQEYLNFLKEKLIELRERINEVALNGNTDELIPLLNGYKEISSQMLTLMGKKFDLVTSKSIDVSVENKEAEIQISATRYGVSPELATDAVKDYKTVLEEIRTLYKNGQTAAMVAYMQTHEKEIKEISALCLQNASRDLELSDEVYESLSFTREEIAGASLEDAKKLAESADAIMAYIDSLSGECENTLKDVTKEDESLTKSDNKENFLTKIFQKFTNKINGKDKFEKNVVAPTQKKTKGIKKVVPFIKNMIKEELAQKLVEVCLFKKGAPIRAIVAEKIVTLLPTIESGAITVASVIASSAAAQALTIAGLAAGAAIIAKIIIDKVKNDKDMKKAEIAEIALAQNAGMLPEGMPLEGLSQSTGNQTENLAPPPPPEIDERE